MFDSQFCSLITITFLVQIFGLFTVVCYRLRGSGRFNQAGLICGIAVMGAASITCMNINPGAGIAQGVALVLVAVSATFGNKSSEASVF